MVAIPCVLFSLLGPVERYDPKVPQDKCFKTVVDHGRPEKDRGQPKPIPIQYGALRGHRQPSHAAFIVTNGTNLNADNNEIQNNDFR